MGLRLRNVEMQRGQIWLRQGVAACIKRPMGFIGLLVGYTMFALLLCVIPLVGPVLAVATWPLLSLAFMLATPEVMQGRPVRMSHLMALWREPPRQRRTMLWLCGGFALAIVLIVLFSVWLGGEALVTALRPLAKSPLPVAELMAIQNDPAVVSTQGWISTLATLLSIPYWHALALVHWGSQSAGQALFSSTIALWRTRGAFMIYGLSWIGFTLLGTLVTALLSALLSAMLGSPLLAMAVGLLILLALSAAFYASLWFMFADTFGVEASELPPIEAS
jgi:hypothetical protein